MTLGRFDCCRHLPRACWPARASACPSPSCGRASWLPAGRSPGPAGWTTTTVPAESLPGLGRGCCGRSTACGTAWPTWCLSTCASTCSVPLLGRPPTLDLESQLRWISCGIFFCTQLNLLRQVYNCTSGSLNPITWGQVEALVPSSIEKAAFEGALWAPKISAKENPYVNKLHQLLFHYGPAHGVDLICRLVGRKPFLTRFDLLLRAENSITSFSSGSAT